MLRKDRIMQCVFGTLLICYVVFMAFPLHRAVTPPRLQPPPESPSPPKPPPSPSKLPLGSLSPSPLPPSRTYADLEKSLCKNHIKLQDAKNISQCPDHGIITVNEGGRLGNQMWTYITVWAYARITELKPYLTKCVRSEMAQIFDQLSIPDFEEIAHCPINLYEKYVGFREAFNYTDENLIILPRFNRNVELFLRWREELLKEFRFNENLTENANKILRGFAKNLPEKLYTFIGVHVRRTDFIHYIEGKYGHSAASHQFYVNGMNYYENKYGNCLFIFISDDPTWCYREFGNKENVYVASYSVKEPNTPGEDMAIMAACNHSIIDYGTFGEWAAILAGGETVYSNVTVNTHSSLNLPGWIMMNN